MECLHHRKCVGHAGCKPSCALSLNQATKNGLRIGNLVNRAHHDREDCKAAHSQSEQPFTPLAMSRQWNLRSRNGPNSCVQALEKVGSPRLSNLLPSELCLNKDDVRVTALQQELLDALLAGVQVKLIRIEAHKHLFTRLDIHTYVTREANALLRKGMIECIGGRLHLVRKERSWT